MAKNTFKGKKFGPGNQRGGNRKRKDDMPPDNRNGRREDNSPEKDGSRSGKGSYYVMADALHPFNAFSWYNKNPHLVEAAASIPFPYRPGMTMKIDGSVDADLYIPGVMSLQWAPTIGQSSLPTDPASIAAKEMYGKVREAFSGSIDADAPDFPIYLCALDSIDAYIGALKRLFRIVNAYTPENYAIPDLLLAALGCTPNTIADMRANRMKMYQYINELVGMTHKFRCPAVYTLSFNQ